MKSPGSYDQWRQWFRLPLDEFSLLTAWGAVIHDWLLQANNQFSQSLQACFPWRWKGPSCKKWSSWAAFWKREPKKEKEQICRFKLSRTESITTHIQNGGLKRGPNGIWLVTTGYVSRHEQFDVYQRRNLLSIEFNYSRWCEPPWLGVSIKMRQVQFFAKYRTNRFHKSQWLFWINGSSEKKTNQDLKPVQGSS